MQKVIIGSVMLITIILEREIAKTIFGLYSGSNSQGLSHPNEFY